MPSFRKLLDAFDDQFEFSDRSPGEVVRDQRKKNSWTLKDLAEVTGIRENNLSAIENGKIAMSSHYAEIFGAAFGIPAFFFLYPNGQPVKTKQLEAIERRALKITINGPAKKSPAKKSKAG